MEEKKNLIEELEYQMKHKAFLIVNYFRILSNSQVKLHLQEMMQKLMQNQLWV